MLRFGFVRLLVAVLLLPGCSGCGTDIMDVDSAYNPEPSLADAPVAIRGESGDMAGSTVADAGDSNGDGIGDLVVVGIGGRVTCVFLGPVVSAGLHDASTCLTQAAAYDFAGQAVAGGADLDGDGFSELLVGGPGADGGGDASGGAWLLSGPLPPGEASVADTDRSWSGVAASDGLGSAVAFAGDADGDGIGDILLGAPGSDAGGAEMGAVYLYPGLEGALEPTAVFIGGGPVADAAKHATNVTGDGVGTALCTAGDLDGDGLDDVVIPAPGSDVSGENGGAVGIFLGPITEAVYSLEQSDTLLTSARAGGFAGGAVACGGDTDSDGRGEVLIGADATGGGRVYLWRGGALDDAFAFVGDDAEQFGFSVAFVPASGTGKAGVVIGAPSADNPAVDAGRAAYFTDIPASGTVEFGDDWTGEDAGDLAGTSVAGLANVDGAGGSGFVVGAPYNREPEPIGGAAYVLGGG